MPAASPVQRRSGECSGDGWELHLANTERLSEVITYLTDCNSASLKTVCPPPCLGNPYWLVSLWDMQFYADKAIHAMELLARLEIGSQLGQPDISSPSFHEHTASEFDELASALREIELDRQAGRASDIAAFSRTHHEWPSHQELRELSLLIHHDLKGFKFEAVPSLRVPYYESPNLFGDDVNKNFASTEYDIKEAGKCFALGRWTASVFHLMRGLGTC